MLVFPALAFSEGTVHVWTEVSIAAGAWFSWTILGKRLRRYTIAEELLTLPDFFEKRFADRTGTLRTLSAVLTMFFIMFYVNSGLIAGAKLLETIFGLEHNPSVLITLVTVVSYTFIGGFMAVSRTDVFQSLVMLVRFIILTNSKTVLPTVRSGPAFTAKAGQSHPLVSTRPRLGLSTVGRLSGAMALRRSGVRIPPGPPSLTIDRTIFEMWLVFAGSPESVTGTRRPWT